MGTAQCSSNRLAQAQLRPRAFQARAALSDINFGTPEPDAAHPNRCLPDCCFLEAGIVALALPTDFNRTGSAACASCQQLQSVDLFQADVLEILDSAFAHCSQLQQLCLSRNLRIIEQEAFLKCTSLQEVSIPPSLLYIARRAFAGCAQLRAIREQGKSKTWREMPDPMPLSKCKQLDQPKWLRFLPADANDYGEKTFWNLHQRPAMSRREWCVSTPPGSYVK